jgi:hypothetical protein
MLTLPFILLLFRQKRGRHGDGSFVLTYIAKGGMLFPQGRWLLKGYPLMLLPLHLLM